MTKGVVLLAFGKRGYGYAAFNMALSLKRFNSKLKIALIHDGEVMTGVEPMGIFDKQIKMRKSDFTDKDGRLDPCKAKVKIYKNLPFDHNLYLDVDGIALQDVSPLLDSLIETDGYYLTDVKGVGGLGDEINYAIWAKQSDIWKHFKLPKSAKYPAIQSSFAYIQKGDEAKDFFDTALKLYESDFPKSKLSMQWGGSLPDELIFSVACAKHKIVPKIKGQPIFFGWQNSELTLTEIAQRFYVLSIYGNGIGQTLTKLMYLEWYDRLLVKYGRRMGIPHRYKRVYIMRDKWANNRN